MPIYEYKGQQYDIETDDAAAAKGKILGYLGKQKTTYGEDGKIGWAQVGKTVQDAAEVGMAGLFGLMEDLPGATPARNEKMAKLFGNIQGAGDKTHKDLDTWSNPDKKEQSFGGKAASLAMSLPGQIAAMPFSPAQTGKDFIDAGETLDKAQTASLIDTAGNVVGFGLPGVAGTGILTKAASGFGINAAQDAATRQGISSVADTDKMQKQYAPTLETTALAGMLGGAIGAISPNGRAEAPPSDKPSGEPGPTLALGEKELVQKKMDEAQRQSDYAEYQIGELTKKLTDPANARRSPEEAGQLREEILQQVTEHQKDITRLGTTIENGNAILRGEEPAPKGQTDFPSSLPPRPDGEGPLPEDSGIAPDPARIDPAVLPEEIGPTVPERLGDASETPVLPDEISIIPTPELEARLMNLDTSTPEGKTSFEAIASEMAARVPPMEKAPIINGGSPKLREVLDGWLKKLGLDKENIEINLDSTHGSKDSWNGNATVRPDGTAEVNVRSGEAFQQRLEADPTLRRWIKGLSDEQNARFREAWTAAHELGHILFAKLIQNKLYSDSLGVTKLLKEFEAYKAKNGLAAVRREGDLMAIPKDKDYYLDFPEFFAQRVAKTLLLGDKAPTGPITHYIKAMKEIWGDLRKQLNLPMFSKNFVDDFILDIVAKNKESLAQTGKTLFEIESTTVGLYEAWTWQFNHLFKDKGRDRGAVGMQDVAFGQRRLAAMAHIEDAQTVVAKQQETTDINPAGTAPVLSQLGQLFNRTGSNLFGIQQKKGIYSQSPVIQHAANVILDSLAKQTQRSMELLSGVADRLAWNATNNRLFTNLQRVAAGDSPTIVFNKSTDADFHEVHQVFEAGIGKFSYEESLAQNGSHFTPQQRQLFTTLSKMYARMYKMAEGLEGELGKKKIIPQMKGWFPSVRQGEFVVNFHRAGLEVIGEKLPGGERVMSDLVYSQPFRTREEAQAFLALFEKQSPEAKGKLAHNGVEERGKSEQPNSMAEFARIVQEQIDVAGQRGIDPKEQIQRLVDQYITRGGTLGSHHKLRTNVPGAMGSEMFRTGDSAGKAFRDAQFDSVNEYTRLMMKMEIGEKLDLVLNNDDLKNTHPNTMEVAQLMRDYALNQVESPLEFKGVKRWFDKMWSDSFRGESKVRKLFGAKKYPDAPIVDVIHGKAAHFFYLHVLLGRPAFWGAQATQFLWAGRSLVKDGMGPIDAMAAGSKGLMKLMSPDKDFMDAVFWTSQNTHTFSPQFINDLNKFHVLDFIGEGKLRTVIDILTGEKPATMADTFSRMAAFSMMHEHYKAQGLTGQVLWQKAAEKTDENMVQYGRQYKAPIFQKLGVVGDMISPLMTFPQAALGNLLADAKQILDTPLGKGKLKAALPLMMTTVITTLIAGAIGAPAVAEYELMRLILNKIAKKLGMDAELPSIIDMVLQGDNDFSNRVLSHGLVSASTMEVSPEGYDLGSANRWQPILNGVMDGQKSALEWLPVVNFMFQQGGHYGTIWSSATGLTPASEAELRVAKLGIAPGWTKGLVEESLGTPDREMVPDNKGHALLPNSNAERASKFMGTSTIDAQTERLRNRRFVEEKLRKQEKQTHVKALLADAVIAGDSAKIKDYVLKLATDHGMDNQSINNFLETEFYKRKVPQGMRRFIGKNGTSTKQQKRDYQRWMNTYEDSPFREEEPTQ